MARDTNSNRRNWGAYWRRKHRFDKSRVPRYSIIHRLVAPALDVRAHYGGEIPAAQRLLDDLSAGELPAAWLEDPQRISSDVDIAGILGDMVSGDKVFGSYVQIVPAAPESLLALITCERLQKK